MLNHGFISNLNEDAWVDIEPPNGPFYQHGLTLIPAWMNNFIHYKCGMKLFIHSQTLAVAPLKFGNGYVISSHILPRMWLLIRAGIKVNPW